MFTGYLATLNTVALMPEALIASVFLPDLYTTSPVERTETALPPTEVMLREAALAPGFTTTTYFITKSALIYHRIFLTPSGSGSFQSPLIVKSLG